MPPSPALPSRHLVMVCRPGMQSPEDFVAIARKIMASAPDVGVFVAIRGVHDEGLEQAAAARPLLVFSPGPLKTFLPRRGVVLAGRKIDKPSQLARLAAMGLPVPKWTLLQSGIRLDPAEWRPHVMIKPAGASSAHGIGLSVMRPADVCYRPPEDYPEGHHGRLGPLIVQDFVITGKAATSYRVNTLFGAPLYAIVSRRTKPLPDLNAGPGPIESDAIATNPMSADDRLIALASEPDVLDLARRCHQAFPDIPVMGVDIIREESTGKLYVLELNCSGATWHISSAFWAKFRKGPLSRENMIAQFGAWDVAAKVLIEKTRELAR